MASPECERAIEDAVQYGFALLRSISPNDVGLTGGHQYGYYIPKDDRVWPAFTPQPPEKGKNYTHPIEIVWQNGRVTHSTVKWYGVGTRSEYRITAFGKDFPFISHLVVGDLLVLIPTEKQKSFRGYVLDNEEDIEEITASLGASPARKWAVYDAGATAETEEECIEKQFLKFVKDITTSFPKVELFSAESLKILQACMKGFDKLSADDAILRSVDLEYSLYRRAELKVFAPLLVRAFKDLDEFIAAAQKVLQGRKSRAGYSLENHVEHYLKQAGIPHVMQPAIEGEPDCVIPSVEAYNDPKYPLDRLFVLGVKRTCKDRWRQVLNEAPRVSRKHLFTLQQGISEPQCEQMRKANVSLVVPKAIHKQYPPEERDKVLVSFDGFIEQVQKKVK